MGGYKTPENVAGEYYKEMPSQLISIGTNDELVVSFVTHDRFGLATRDFPPLSLHLVRFTAKGEFLSQVLMPTPSWNENAVFLGSNGNYLLRAGDKIRLLSPSMERLAEMEVPVSRNSVRLFWRVYPLPDRSAALLYRELGRDNPVSLLSWDDLKPIRECVLTDYEFLESVSNRNLLVSDYTSGDTQKFEAWEICGAEKATYTWDGGPSDATLTNDDSLLLAGTSNDVRFMAGGKVKWIDAFDKKTDMLDQHVEVGAGGRVLAVAVKTFVGGNRFLDIGPHLKSIRMVVYEATTGKRLLDMPVTPTPKSMFDFALSPPGDILAVVSDGSLSIVSLK